jgi:hypothetical protein
MHTRRAELLAVCRAALQAAKWAALGAELAAAAEGGGGESVVGWEGFRGALAAVGRRHGLQLSEEEVEQVGGDMMWCDCYIL